MSTNINISVQGRNLASRLKAQQEAARARRLTEESNAKRTEQNRAAILREARATPTLTGPLQPFGRPGSGPVRRLEPAATRFGALSPYFIYLKVGGSSNIRVSFTFTNKGVTYSNFPDVVYTNDYPAAYLYLPTSTSVETFKQSRAWQTVSPQIQYLTIPLRGEIPDPAWPTNLRNFTKVNSISMPKLRENPKQSISADVTTDAQKTSYTIRMINRQPEPFGYLSRSFIIYGFTQTDEYAVFELTRDVIFGEQIVNNVFTLQGQFIWSGTTYLRGSVENPFGQIYAPTANNPFPYYENYPYMFRPNAPYLIP